MISKILKREIFVNIFVKMVAKLQKLKCPEYFFLKQEILF